MIRYNLVLLNESQVKNTGSTTVVKNGWRPGVKEKIAVSDDVKTGSVHENR